MIPAAESTVTSFARLDSMTVYPLASGHVLAVPGRHEACPACLEPVEPASVLDEVQGVRGVGRIATYRCACSAAWLCWWAAPSCPATPRRTR